MLNIEKYKYQILNSYKEKGLSIECAIGNVRGVHLPCNQKCNACQLLSMVWLFEEYKEPVLDEAEKAYLSAVIEPFRKKIAYIVKLQDFIEGKQFIKIILQNDDRLSFPYFDYDSMYKGMETNKRYSLEELGL